MNSEQIRSMLEGSATRTPQRPARDFWHEFRSRAEGMVRNDADPLAIASSRRKRLRVAWMAAPLTAVAAALLVAALWIDHPAVLVPGAIRSYQVGEDLVHGGILILDDEPSRATILWIADCSESA